MALSSSSCEIARTRGLPLLSPGRMTLPSLLPLRAASSESRRNPALGRSEPWQRVHEAWSSGWMSLAKVRPGCVEGAGSLLRSTSMATAEYAPAATARNRDNFIFLVIVLVNFIDLGLMFLCGEFGAIDLKRRLSFCGPTMVPLALQFPVQRQGHQDKQADKNPQADQPPQAL